MFGLWKRWRRRSLMARELPPEWLDHLERHVPFFGALRGEDRERFLGHVKVFAWEKHFIGAGGLTVTDEHRVVIAAAAARLIQHLDLRCYDRLREIVVYPYVYQHPEGGGAILGEAHHWGTVVLSWPAVLEGLADPSDGHDTAVHEFAHVLDRASGAFDGTPPLHGREDYRAWATVMSESFLSLRRGLRCRRVLRSYGATNEAEFFAVATEAFFETPDELARCAPDLYAELSRFYRFDPADDVGAG